MMDFVLPLGALLQPLQQVLRFDTIHMAVTGLCAIYSSCLLSNGTSTIRTSPWLMSWEDVTLTAATRPL